MCCINVSSKVIVEDLIGLGCIPRKTNRLKFVDCVQDELMRHFIRGYFDGNGSIYMNKCKSYKYVRCSISSGSYEFLFGLSKYLEEIGIKSFITNDRNSYKLFIGGKHNCKRFADYMYKDSNIYLDRKYEKYLSYCA